MSVLQKLGFPSWQTAYRWVQRQLEYGHIAVLGEIRGVNGKPQKVYGTKSKTDNLTHEVAISSILVNCELEGVPWKRGEDVNRQFRADVEIEQYGRTFALEVDMNTERRRALERRLKIYQGFDGFVLVATTGKRRIEEVKDVGSFLAEQLLCTTIEKASRDPFAEIWEDVYGRTTSF